MKSDVFSPVDAYFDEALRRDPRLAKEAARQFAELPLATQLGLLRRERWLSQQRLARKLGIKQPQVARMENPDHDPRLSSIEKQAAALGCRIALVPKRPLETSKSRRRAVAGRRLKIV